MNAPVSLRRVLKFRTIVSTSTGLAYAAISFLGCIQLASYLEGDSGWIAILIAGLLAVLAALCFSELFAISAFNVYLGVPRIRAAAAAQRTATSRRRPRGGAQNTEVSQG